jgi:hypothetical protein
VSALLIFCSKSIWRPAIRREHALASTAAAHGHSVVFLERPLDIRTLSHRRSARRWLRASIASTSRPREGAVTIVPTAALVPGHRGSFAENLEARRLRRDLARVEGIESATVVATQPWQWPAVRAASAARVVFDCADDWASLMPHRQHAIDAWQVRIGHEADAVIAVSPDLAAGFGTRLHVVPNGTHRELLCAPVRPPRSARRMVYVGTLSERFDAELVRAVLTLLPEWRLEIYGPAQYAGQGSRPAAEMRNLLAWGDGRVSWRPAIERSALAEAIDGGDVGVLPHRIRYTRGQDSMKFYDYAARGRPVVSTTPLAENERPVAGAVTVAAGPLEFAQAVDAAASAPPTATGWLRRWAEERSWDARWEAWQKAAWGAP